MEDLPSSLDHAPCVSIIIAAYNCEDTLPAAVESALRETDVAIEVIIVDDASKDGTMDIARCYEATGQVRAFRNDVNRGPSYSRNHAIRQARGKWVAQLDGDDWFAPGRLPRLMAAADIAGADVVADDLYLVDHHSLRATSTRFTDNGVPWKSKRLVSASELVRYDLGSVKPLIRRDFLLRHQIAYPEGIKYGEDFQFLLKLLLVGARALIIPQAGYHLRRGNTGSLTTERTRLFEQVAQGARDLLRDEMVRNEPQVVEALHGRIRHIQLLEKLDEMSRLAKTEGAKALLSYLLVRPHLLPAALRRAIQLVSMRARRARHGRSLKEASAPPLARLDSRKT